MPAAHSKNPNVHSGTQYVGTTIGVKDSGTILGTVPPGKPGIKQVDGTQHSATKVASAKGIDGNYVDASTNGQAAGFSLLGE